MIELKCLRNWGRIPSFSQSMWQCPLPEL